MDKFDADYKILKDAVAEIEGAKGSAELNAIDSKIGASLRSMQIGLLAVAREIKQKVEDKRASF